MKQLNPAIDDIDEIVTVLRQTLQTVRFGSVEVVIHDGRVVQIDRKEKLRMPPAAVASRQPGSHGK